MTSTAQLLAFTGVVALGAMSPGPDFAVVVRRSALSGLVGTLRRVFMRAPVRRALDAVSGTVLIALGIRLAATTAR